MRLRHPHERQESRFSTTVNNTLVFPLVRELVPPARTGRKGRKLSRAFVQVEAAYGLGA